MIKIGVRCPTRMPELKENPTARLMDRLRDLPPPIDMGVRVDSRLMRPCKSIGGDHGGFGKNQSSGCPLGVIPSHEFAGHVVGIRSSPSQRCHQNAIGQDEIAHADGFEQAHRIILRSRQHCRRTYLHLSSDIFDVELAVHAFEKSRKDAPRADFVKAFDTQIDQSAKRLFPSDRREDLLDE